MAIERLKRIDAADLVSCMTKFLYNRLGCNHGCMASEEFDCCICEEAAIVVGDKINRLAGMEPPEPRELSLRGQKTAAEKRREINRYIKSRGVVVYLGRGSVS